VSMEVANPRFWPGDRSSVFLCLSLLFHRFYSYLCRYFPSRPVLCYPQFAFYFWHVRDLCFLLFQETGLFKAAHSFSYKIYENVISVSHGGFTDLLNSNRKDIYIYLFIYMRT
jgi:hypothetical protein